MSAVFSVKLPYKMRCNLPDCGKPVNLVFKQEIEGHMNTFCSPYHAREGEKRWMEKLNQGIKPGITQKPSQEEYIGDNLEEVINGEEMG